MGNAARLQQRGILTAERYRLLTEIERLRYELRDIERRLARLHDRRAGPRPGSFKATVIDALRVGKSKLRDITAYASTAMGRQVTTNATANHLRELRASGIVMHVGREWSLIDVEDAHAASTPTSTNSSSANGR